MARDYFPCFHSYRTKLAKLSDQEVGRLFRALLTYSETGEPQELAGREAVAYDFIADDIDRAKGAYESKCQQMQANASKSKQMQANAPKEKEKEKEKQSLTKEDKGDSAPRARFVPPSLAEIAAYCEERGNSVNPRAFLDYYAANGWVQGKNKPIKDWKACVRTWEAREANQRNNSTSPRAQSGAKHGQIAGEGELDYFERKAIEDLQARMKEVNAT